MEKKGMDLKQITNNLNLGIAILEADLDALWYAILDIEGLVSCEQKELSRHIHAAQMLEERIISRAEELQKMSDDLVEGI